MVKRGRGRTVRGGGSDCAACNQSGGSHCAACNQSGGKMSVLNPESLSGGTFDRSGSALANQAFSQYLKGGEQLASLKGGRSRRQRKGKGRSAKKYSRKSRSKSRSRSNSKY